MKAIKITAGLLILASSIFFFSCENKKTRADIEKDFEDVEYGSYERMTTIEKRTTDSDDPKAFEGELKKDPTAEQKKQLEEEKKKQEELLKAENAKKAEDAKGVEAAASNTENEKSGSDAEKSSTSAENPAAPKANDKKNDQPVNNTVKPAVAEPAKTSQDQQPRQQPVVTKSEPKKRDVVVDGQAQ